MRNIYVWAICGAIAGSVITASIMDAFTVTETTRNEQVTMAMLTGVSHGRCAEANRQGEDRSCGSLGGVVTISAESPSRVDRFRISRSGGLQDGEDNPARELPTVCTMVGDRIEHVNCFVRVEG